MKRDTNSLRKPGCVSALIVMLGGLSLGSGCASYRVVALDALKPDFHPSAIEAGGVVACLQVLDVTSIKRYFGKDLTREGYQPVQVTVANGPDRYLALHVSQISLPGAEPEAVAKECHFHTAARATTYGVIGIFIWPFLIPAIVDGVGASKANGQMDLDFSAKALKDQIIMPYGHASGVLFVPTDQMSSDIVVRLADRENRETIVFRWSDGKPIDGRVEKVGG